MRRILPILFIAVLVSMNIGTGFTQESEEPLLYALSLIPNTEASRSGMIMFADIEALQTAYGTERPASPEAFEIIRNTETSEDNPALLKQVAWWRTLAYFNLPSYLAHTLADGGATSIGIDFFQIDAAISFGNRPEDSLILIGSFDQDAVRAAYSEKGYVQQGNRGAETWCAAIGCEAGSQSNEAAQEPQNPFGGRFGRNQPVVIGESYLMSSPQFTIVEDHVALGESMESLADEPRYRAAVEAVTQEGILVEAAILEPSSLDIVSYLATLSELRSQAVFLRQALQDFVELPEFDLLIIADTVSEKDQILQIGLVYQDRAYAEIAAEVLPIRMENNSAPVYEESLLERLTIARAAMQEPMFYEEVEGFTVMVLTFTTPLPTTHKELIASTKITLNVEELPDVTPPGQLYWFVLHFFREHHGISWLATLPEEELVAMFQEVMQELESDN